MNRSAITRVLALVMAGLASTMVLSGCSRVDDLEAQVEEMEQAGRQLVQRVDELNEKLEEAQQQITEHQERLRSIRVQLRVAEITLQSASVNASLMSGSDAFSVYLEVNSALDLVSAALEETE